MPLNPPCHCHPPVKPEPFTPTFKVIPSPDWTAWIRARLAEKGALLTFSFTSEFPDRGSVTNVYLALDTGTMYRWDGSQYQVLVDPESADDVLTYADRAAFPETGSLGKLYVAVDNGRLYVWNGVAYLELLGGKADKVSQATGGNFAGLDENGNITDSGKKPADYYTKTETDNAIDTLAAYYITYNQAGAAFPTKADLINATTYYSGGVARTPTRNDYAVVSADETHGGAEYRYIYAVPDGATSGQWEAQYPIETNDYTALANKPQINGVALSGNKTGDAVGLVDKAGATMTGALTVPIFTVGSRSNSGVVGQNSIATGNNVTASRPYSHAEGDSTTASGTGAHAEGNSTTANGLYAHAEGSLTTASNQNAHAEGTSTTASNSSAHAEGTNTTASGNSSHAEGKNTLAQNTAEHAQGVNNASHTGNTPAENTLYSIGVGGTPSARQNAVEVMQDGKVFVKGLGGYDGTNPTASGVLSLVAAIYAIVQQIAPAWVSGTSYARYRLVSYNGVVYQYISDGSVVSTTPPDTDTLHWIAKKVSDLFLPLTGGSSGDISFGGGKITGEPPGLVVIDYNDNYWIFYENSGVHQVARLSNIYTAVQQIAPAWVSGTAYTKDALVSYNGVIYQNTSGVTIQSTTTPDTSGSGWTAKKVSELFLLLTGGTVTGVVTAQEFEVPNGASGGLRLNYSDYNATIHYHGASGVFIGVEQGTSGTYYIHFQDKGGTLAFTAGTGHAGNLAALDANGNPTDSGIKASDKLDASSASDPFSSDPSVSYPVGSRCVYNGKLYKCIAATTGGEWDSTKWTPDNMTTPDATLDITAAKQLRVVAVDGEVLWAQGYNIGTTSSATLSNEGLNKYDFAVNATDKVTLTLPTPLSGKVGDFILDVTNPALDATDTSSWAPEFDPDKSDYNVGDVVSYDNKQWRCATAITTAGPWTGSTNWVEALPYFDLSGLGTIFNVVIPVNENLTDMLTFAPGVMAELYFTQTSFIVNDLPAWKIVRQDVEAAV